MAHDVPAPAEGFANQITKVYLNRANKGGTDRRSVPKAPPLIRKYDSNKAAIFVGYTTQIARYHKTEINFLRI